MVSASGFPAGRRFFAGLDIGSSAVKAILLDGEGAVAGYAIEPSGADLREAAAKALAAAARAAESEASAVVRLTATGYGRSCWPEAGMRRTEISCHARGSYHHVRRAHTLVDIGGQDAKIIRVDAQGRRPGFKMNRRCAAGTGAFLEEAARRLRIALEDFDALAGEATQDIEIGAFCTVFTATEILHLVRRNVDVRNIVRGLFGAVVLRTLEMAPLEGEIVMTGGVVAHHPRLVRMFEEKIGRPVVVPPLAQGTGALGAALFALETAEGRDA